MKAFPSLVYASLLLLCACDGQVSSPGDAHEPVTTIVSDTTAWLRGTWRGQCYPFKGNRYERWTVAEDTVLQAQHYCRATGPFVTRVYLSWLRGNDTLQFNRTADSNSYITQRFQIQACGGGTADTLLFEKLIDDGDDPGALYDTMWVPYVRE
jgi:hypothetical protein